HVQVRAVDGVYEDLLRSLREGDLDCLIGALRDPLPASDVTQELLFNDELQIVTHPDHPLASRASVSIEETLAFPWIAPPRMTPPGQYLFQTLRIQDMPRTPVRIVAPTMVMLRTLLAEGDYVSIVSRHQIGLDERDGHIARLNVPLK